MKSLQQYAVSSFQQTALAIEQFIASDLQQVLSEVATAMVMAIEASHKILVCGNGGSACQAMHFAEELTGRYRDNRRALPALALTDSAHMSCVANDYGYEWVFSRALEAYAQPGDYLLLLSTSGNSLNLVNAVKIAKQLGVVTVAFLGKTGGVLKGQCDQEIIVAAEQSDCIQNIHMMAIHVLIELIERQLFPENYQASV